ncbi:MAG: cellulose biosynthesis protein BcsG [Ferrovum sp.]|nr:cellulose biosynthesis protein BcsG [Ferrovum sp.]NDU87588.1 cellulose biosynthesis protein BcsG [Ferrovum sp.]
MNDTADSAILKSTPNPFDSRYRLSLGWWNFYFLIKLLLAWRGVIGLHPWTNLAFILLLAAPIPSRTARILRSVVSIPLGVILLYYDSWLPPVKRVIAQASSLSQFRFAYLLELVERFVHVEMIAMLVVIWILYALISRYLKLGVILTAALFSLAVLHKFDRGESPATPENMAQQSDGQGGAHSGVSDLNYQVNSFFSNESTRQVSFDPVATGSQPFDIVFIHICSLSWSDLKAMGLDTHPLWQTLDVLYTRFNTASTYSGPAAIRLLRAPCGQLPHTGLYSATTDQCYLMGSLQQAGFSPNLLLNHDGHFENFLKTIETQKLGITPMKLEGLRPYETAFDDSFVYDDKDALTQWIQKRSNDPAKHVALYYNTISLHDGNHLVNDNTRASMKSYGTRLHQLLDDISQFMVAVKNSGRNTVVVVIPEHGAAIQGDKYQVAGLREIPTPSITLVPVGIKIIGPKINRADNQRIVSTPSSYLALSQLVANLIKSSPFDNSSYRADDLVRDLPVTKYVAQNADVTMVRDNGQYYLRQDPESGWVPYDAENN